ncbi:MAG: histidine phosphatase family protein [Spirochaetes bacterium]|nr:histidine phosphatase family protein [Spirochaetota bacterium]
MALRLYLLRHGETAWNSEGKYQGQLDIPLNERGRQQALLASRWMARRRLDAIYTSDLSRALNSALPIAEACGVAAVPLAELRERHMGAYQGLSFEEIREKFPETKRKDYRTFARIPGGESAEAFLERVDRAIDRLAETHADGRILAVTHGGFIYYHIRHLLGLPVSTELHVKVANASVHIFDRRESGWTINALGITEHLGGEDVAELA